MKVLDSHSNLTHQTKSTSSSNEIQPVSPNSPNHVQTNSCHTTLEIHQDQNLALPITSTSNSTSSCFPFFKILVLPIKWGLMLCGAYVTFSILALILSLVLSLVYSCIVITTLVATPLLLISLLITRLFQFLSTGDDYDKITLLKFLIRTWICLDMGLIMLETWVFLPMAVYVPHLRDITIVGLPLSGWLKLVPVLAALYIFSYVMCLLPHMLPRIPLEHNESGISVPESVSEVISCLVLCWAESVVASRVYAFKHHQMLGLKTRKWIQVPIFVVIGCNIIKLSTHVIVWLLKKYCRKFNHPTQINTKSLRHFLSEKLLHRKYLVYYASRMRASINFVLCSVLIFITWACYFGSHLNGTVKAKRIFDMGTWACVSLLVCLLLWLMKVCVLLAWKAATVYERLTSKILEMRKQLYFLGILGRNTHNILGLQYDEKNECTNKERVKIDLLTYKGHQDSALTISDVRQVAQYFLSAKTVLSKESFASDIIDYLKKNVLVDDDLSSGSMDMEKSLKQFVTSNAMKPNAIQVSNLSEIEESRKSKSHASEFFEKFIMNLKRFFLPMEENKNQNREEELEEEPEEELEWPDFQDMLKSQQVCLQSIRIWMEKARNSCLFIANTLSSAKEVADCLNHVINGLLIGATFIMWLLLTGLATTKVLVLIASPLLAATFIFGDTCKTLFQGIIFVFVLHPFDVGDLCIIDDKMMEVKAIGVWKTSFSRVEKTGGKEEVIYPNSELANKMVINHKTEFDWDDYLEYDVGSLDKKRIQILKGLIESHLSNEEEEFTSSSHSVVALAMDGKLKIVVRLKHKLRNKQDCTYFECLQRKDQLRCDYYLDIQNLIDEFRKKIGSEISGENGLRENSKTTNGNDVNVNKNKCQNLDQFVSV